MKIEAPPPRQNIFKKNGRDLEVRDAITSIWTIECEGKEFLYKFHKVQRFYRYYCKEKVKKWKDNGKSI